MRKDALQKLLRPNVTNHAKCEEPVLVNDDSLAVQCSHSITTYRACSALISQARSFG